jgi:hypothetical protein
MNWWIFGAVVLGIVVFGYLAQRFGLIDLSGHDKPKSSGTGAGLIGIGDEVFAPARHEAAMELDRQTILPAPAPVAGDPLPGIYNGQVTIDLDRGSRRS